MQGKVIKRLTRSATTLSLLLIKKERENNQLEFRLLTPLVELGNQ
jgi:hypothetical protein